MKWLKRAYKRDWLQKSPKLNTISSTCELWDYQIYTLKEGIDDVPVVERTIKDHYDIKLVTYFNLNLTFSIGSEIIKIHANDNLPISDALGDYIRKLGVMRGVLERFLSDFKPHYDAEQVFVLKEFLNSATGPSAVYTSMVAVGTSVTHSFFLDIASCTDKARLYEYTEKDFVNLITKLTKFITTTITDMEAIVEKYKDKF